MKKKNVKNYYELRLSKEAWGTGYYSYSVRGAIRQFLSDPLYNLCDGMYSIEVRGFPEVFFVEKETTTVTKTKYKIKKNK